jgi:hypothetical protein
MAGVNFNATSFATRLMEIETALSNPKNKKVVNDRAELVNRENGFVRFLKILVLPIARFFGADPFYHTRVNRVATTLIFQFLKLENELAEEDGNRLRGIITKLDEKTKHRYGNVMSVFKSIIPTTTVSKKLPPPPPPPAPPPMPMKNVINHSSTTAPSVSTADGGLAGQLQSGSKTLKKTNTDNKQKTDSPQDMLAAALKSKFAPKPSVQQNSPEGDATTPVPPIVTEN